MFGIGMPEMLLLLAVALIVFGPKKLPELAKSLGRALGEFKRATTDLKESIETETGLGDVRDTIKDAAADAQKPAPMAGDLPDPAPAEPEPADAPGEAGEAGDEPGDPLKKVKAAFDELNPHKGDPGEFTRPADEGPSEDPSEDTPQDASQDASQDKSQDKSDDAPEDTKDPKQDDAGS